MILIGVAGRIASGKDTIANYLMRRHGFTRIGFFDAGKQEAEERYRKTVLACIKDAGQDWWSRVPVGRDVDEPYLIHRILWDDRTPVIRAFLQDLGASRRLDDEDYWVRRWAERMPSQMGLPTTRPHRIVTPDVRYPNEAAEIELWDGILIHVERPGQPEDNHVTETSIQAWSRWDAKLYNDGTIPELEAKVEQVLEELGRVW